MLLYAMYLYSLLLLLLWLLLLYRIPEAYQGESQLHHLKQMKGNNQRTKKKAWKWFTCGCRKTDNLQYMAYSICTKRRVLDSTESKFCWTLSTKHSEIGWWHFPRMIMEEKYSILFVDIHNTSDFFLAKLHF